MDFTFTYSEFDLPTIVDIPQACNNGIDLLCPDLQLSESSIFRSHL